MSALSFYLGSKNHFKKLSRPTLSLVLLLLFFSLPKFGFSRTIPQALIECESLLLKGLTQEAQSCLISKKPAELSANSQLSVYWLELWMQYLLHDRDINQKTQQKQLKDASNIATTWLRSATIENQNKQRLSYLVYLYYSGFESNTQFSQISPVIVNSQPQANHFFLAFMILVSVCCIAALLIFSWDRSHRLSSSTRLPQEQRVLQHHVKERNQELIQHYSRLQDYSIANSHLVRAPLARLLGLVELMKEEPLTRDGQFYLQNMAQSCEELDDWVIKMNTILDEQTQSQEANKVLDDLSHFLSIEK